MLAIEIATEAQTAVKVSFPQSRTNLSQAVPLQCGHNIIANYFPLSKDKIVKVKL
jgi:type IV secretory pathway protease TraF